METTIEPTCFQSLHTCCPRWRAQPCDITEEMGAPDNIDVPTFSLGESSRVNQHDIDTRLCGISSKVITQSNVVTELAKPS